MLSKYGTKEHSNGLLSVAMTGVNKLGLISFIRVYEMWLIKSARLEIMSKWHSDMSLSVPIAENGQTTVNGDYCLPPT